MNRIYNMSVVECSDAQVSPREGRTWGTATWRGFGLSTTGARYATTVVGRRSLKRGQCACGEQGLTALYLQRHELYLQADLLSFGLLALRV